MRIFIMCIMVLVQFPVSSLNSDKCIEKVTPYVKRLDKVFTKPARQRLEMKIQNVLENCMGTV